MKYDVLIIGSGLGGLLTGAILSKNGYHVCILEKNPKIGGCLQSYHRDGTIFDTGVHYIGSMGKGQTLYQIFNYLGILPELKLMQMDPNGFERITYVDDPNTYRYAQGYENFIETLSEKFPTERQGIEDYCKKMQYVCDRFPLYRLENGSFETKLDVIGLGAYDEIASCTSNQKLQSVLAGTNLLYAGIKEKTPFYIHALIINSYIEGAWRLVGGGSQLATALEKIIKKNGGEILTSMEVSKLVEEGGSIKKVQAKNGEIFTANKIISAIDPTTTINMTETNMFRQVFYKRYRSFEHSYSVFIVNAKMKESRPELATYNHYHYNIENSWDYNNDNFPNTFVMFPAADKDGCRAISIMTYFSFGNMKKWEDTCNTAFTKGNRGQEYEDFKAEKAEQLLSLVETKYPGFKSQIEKIHTVSPLTYRDYTGTIEGSIYGISKDYNEPMKTFIPHQSKISNLLFTGQNLNMHGILGVAISSLMTCSALVDINVLLDEIKR